MEIRFELLPLPNHYTAPAHPHATDAAVYTALLKDFSSFPHHFYHIFSFFVFMKPTA